jgi:hypothetical protein
MLYTSGEKFGEQGRQRQQNLTHRNLQNPGDNACRAEVRSLDDIREDGFIDNLNWSGKLTAGNPVRQKNPYVLPGPGMHSQRGAGTTQSLRRSGVLNVFCEGSYTT